MTFQLSADKFNEPFDTVGFVERASRAGGSGGFSGLSDHIETEFDVTPVLSSFEATIDALMILHENIAAEVAVLESNAAKKEATHRASIENLQESTAESVKSLASLGERVSRVATKIVHVGDQLETIHAKRLRAEEAEMLMKHFHAFEMSDDLLPPFDDITLDNLPEAAEIIRQLQAIAVELPFEQYKEVKKRIDRCFDDVEQRLLREFNEASTDFTMMRRYAHLLTLYPFKSFNSLVTSFLTITINREFPQGVHGDVFRAISATIKKVGDVIVKVFTNPPSIVSLFIEEILATLLVSEVSKQMNFGTALYLDQLSHYHKKTKEMLKEVTSPFDSLDSHFCDKMLDMVYGEYLETYISQEEDLLCENYEKFLDGFYDSIGHVRQFRKPGAKFEQFTHDPSETFVSVDAATMIADNKSAIKRCKELSAPAQLPENVHRLFLKLLEYLCVQHIDYAVSIAIEELPHRKPKTEPGMAFFQVLRDTNNIFYLLQKHFWDEVLPLVRPSLVVYPRCVNKKNDVMERIESQLALGVERMMDCMLDWTRFILTRDQKKTDFKQDDNADMEIITSTSACESCCQFIAKSLKVVKKCLNGKNLDNFLKEFGTQFHRALLEHIRLQSFSTEGGMVLSCDLSEYVKLSSFFKDDFITELFATLHEISSLLVVRPENIMSLCSEGRLTTIDMKTITSFLELRADYATKVKALFVK